MRDEIDELTPWLRRLDWAQYERAKHQASILETYLIENPDIPSLTIIAGTRTFKLDITHTDVIDQVYGMLNNLINLSK